ncbi:hypothetical protein ScPMuIL_008112 [Solemya velum]
MIFSTKSPSNATAMALPLHPYQMGVSAQGPGSVPGPGLSPGPGMPPAYQPIVGQQPPPVPPHQSQPMTSPKKDVNALSLCRLGQETVQEIVQKVLEIFNVLQTGKGVLLPTGVGQSPQLYQEKRTKIDDHMKVLNSNVDRLRIIYDRLSDIGDDGDLSSESLIPIVGQPYNKPPPSEVYHYVSEEHKELVEKVRSKNRQLKQVVDQIRTILWEINTMIVMRKT